MPAMRHFRFWLVVIQTIVAAHLLGAGLSWQPIQGHRSASLSPGPSGRTGFTKIDPAASGIRFANTVPESRHLTNQIVLNGSGVAAGDVDGDGWCDLYFCRTDGANALFRNLGGWRFEEVTSKSGAGLGCENMNSTGCAMADLDGDGDLDLVVNTLGHGTHVFFNDGHGRFEHAPFVLNEGRGGMSMALGDLDSDGFLDLYIANYRVSGLMDVPNARATFKTIAGKMTMDTFNGRSTTAPDLRDRFAVGPGGSIEENGEADVLYRSLGGTNFVAIPFTGGAFLDEQGRALEKAPLDWGLSVMIRDVNRDGLPDLYVCNDFQTEDRLWINQGGGKLRLAPSLALRKTSRFSMGIDFADINRDGHTDFLVLDMLSRSPAQRKREIPEPVLAIAAPGRFEDRPQFGMNTLFLNRGDGTYAEISQLAGLEASEWSWGCVFVDVDLDGWEDVLISNGMERAARDADVAERIKAMRKARSMADADIFEARKSFPRLSTPNLAFRNRRDLTFEDTSAAWNFDQSEVSQGMALADLDNDGDADVILNNFNAPATLLRNDSTAPRLAVRLRGATPNTRGIGARIDVTGGDMPAQSQEIISGGRYLSSDDALRVFACGPTEHRFTIEVHWRSGRRSRVTNAIPNRVYEVSEDGEKTPDPTPALRLPVGNGEPEVRRGAVLFEDVSQRLDHAHLENAFDDFVRQPLLPHRLSQLGPAAAWFDLNGDGWDDLILGGAKSGRGAIYLNDGQGGFSLSQDAFGTAIIQRDHTGVLARRGAGTVNHIVAAFSNFEDGLTLGAGIRQQMFSSQEVIEVSSAQAASFGPLALGALGGTDAPALFAGGRVKPGKYPAPGSSLVFKFIDAAWRIDTETSQLLRDVGMVSGAVWSDLTGDGFPELILACEWGPIKIFRNREDRLAVWDPEVESDDGSLMFQKEDGSRVKNARLSDLTGFWTSVATGDFDGDGRLDLVAGNWGRNTSYESRRSRPLHAHFGDLDFDGILEMAESHFDTELRRYVPWANLSAMAKVLPSVRSRFETHADYARAGIEEVLGEHGTRMNTLSVAWMESALFLNRGERFLVRPLPVEAQFAPVFGLVAADFDGDGFEDLFAAQNFFGTSPGSPRLDGGRALLMRGDGLGGLKSVPGQESGLAVYGEQRAAAASDIDHDGRLDLVVTQNGAATKLYRNAGGRRCVRVQLAGGKENPAALGATLWIQSGKKRGPAREIQAGSGYWSQNSAIQLFAASETEVEVWVRWPGGKAVSKPLPPGTMEILISQE